MHVHLCFIGLVFSWGDGDFGKLGRGGSEGCNIPQNIERLNGQSVCQIECGAQFSLALTKSGVVWTWYECQKRFGLKYYYSCSLLKLFNIMLHCSGVKGITSDWVMGQMFTSANPRWLKD